MAPLWVLQKVYASGPSVRERRPAPQNGTLTLICGRCPASLCIVNVWITPNPASFQKQFPSVQPDTLQFQPQPFDSAEEPAHQANTGSLSLHKTLLWKHVSWF